MKQFLCLALTFVLATAVWADAPANDNFADAQVITSLTDVTSGTTVDATLETGEAEAIGEGWTNSVWFKFNLGKANTQKVTIDVKAVNPDPYGYPDCCVVFGQGTSFSDLNIIYKADTGPDENFSATINGNEDYVLGVYTCADNGPFTVQGSIVEVKDWYCAPFGTGSGDSFEDPCSLKTAIENVATGNTVYMDEGVYYVTAEANSTNERWCNGNFVKLSTSGVSIVGSGSASTIIFAQNSNDVGFVVNACSASLKGFSVLRPTCEVAGGSWGGAYYSLVSPLMFVDALDVESEDLYCYVGNENGLTDLDNSTLVRPASIQMKADHTASFKNCAFISEGLLTAVNIKPWTWDAPGEASTLTTINFDYCTFRSNKDVAAAKSGYQDHRTAVYGNCWYGNIPMNVNISDSVFLNTDVPVGQQANNDEVVWNFNVKNCFMQGADLTKERVGHANVTYTNCDNVIDPKVDKKYVASNVKAGFGTEIKIGTYKVVVNDDFSSCEPGNVIGKGIFTYGYGGANDGTAECVEEEGNKYIKMTKNSGLFGVHYNMQDVPATGWAGKNNPYRYIVYSAKEKISGDNPSLAFAFWDPGLQEIGLSKQADGYHITGQNSFVSESVIPTNEWFELTLVFDANTSQVYKNDGIKNAHILRQIGVNGKFESCECVPGQEGNSDTFKTLRYFFWSNGTLCIDDVKVIFTCEKPDNDYLAYATTIKRGETLVADNTGARLEPGENPNDQTSVWFSYKPEAAIKTAFSTKGSNKISGFDAMMAVYTANTPNPTMADLTVVKELQDTGYDEEIVLDTVDPTKFYFICVCGCGTEGQFKFYVGDLKNIYVSTDGKGDGSSPENPTSDLVWAMENVSSGASVILAPGEYSIAKYYNQTDIWGSGMTALVFKVDNSTLRGAGPDKTTILVPDGYVGVRIEKKDCKLADLTVKKLGQGHPVNHYNQHMNGNITVCNNPGVMITNVALYTETTREGEGKNGFRPFVIYSACKNEQLVAGEKPISLINVAIEAPNHDYPVFINQSSVVCKNVSVKGASTSNSGSVYIGQWPWGGTNTVSLTSCLLDGGEKIGTIENKGDVHAYHTLAQNKTESVWNVMQGGLLSEAGTFTPNPAVPLETKNGLILYPMADGFDGCGWQQPVYAPGNDNLADAYEAQAGVPISGKNTLATVETGENAAHKASVWYKFTPAEDGTYRISNTGSYVDPDNKYDAVLSVYSLSGEVSFTNLTAIVESQDTGTDEVYDLKATAGTTYYICWDGYDGSQGKFVFSLTKLNEGTWYVAPGATGSGTSPDDPTGDLAMAMNMVCGGQTVSLAAGEYSIADHFNQIDAWGTGMTILCFKAENVTLKGAGPDKTVIKVPAGYVGIRMERNGSVLQDLTVKAYGEGHFVDHYNFHMQGAVCLCNCSDMKVINVGIYSEQGAGANAIRPLSTYSCKNPTYDTVAVEAPNCTQPVFFNQVTGATATKMTVQGKFNMSGSGIYVGQWPWGGDQSLTFSKLLVGSHGMPFTVEKTNSGKADVTVNRGAFYGCESESRVDEGSTLTLNDVDVYAEGVNDPEFAEVAGYILTTSVKAYKGIGWHTLIAENPSAMIGYDLQGSGFKAVEGNDGFEVVWTSDYFASMYICGSAVEFGDYIYLVNDPSPNATVLRISKATGAVEEWLTEPSWDNGAACITDEGYLYVCDEKANLCKFDVTTKETEWIVTLAASGERLCSSAVKFCDGNVFVKVSGKGLFIVSSEGKVMAQYVDADCQDGWGGNGVSFSPDKTTVYYKDPTKVVAVKVADGSLAWTATTDANDNLSCREPIVGADGTVYTEVRPGDNAGKVMAFNADGSKKWEATLAAKIGDDGGLAFNADGSKIFASYQEGFAVISTADGTITKVRKIGHVRNSVIKVNGTYTYAVTEGSNGSFLVCTKSGDEEPVWSYQISTKADESCHMRPIVLDNGDVFCGTPTSIACVRPVIPEPAIFGLLALVALFLRRK